MEAIAQICDTHMAKGIGVNATELTDDTIFSKLDEVKQFIINVQYYRPDHSISLFIYFFRLLRRHQMYCFSANGAILRLPVSHTLKKFGPKKEGVLHLI